jgi:DNA modification methylase
MVAFALRADGWYLRSDIIWAKPNPMPESVTDRPTKAHEYLFLLTKSPRYFYDADAIRAEATHAGQTISLGPKSMSVGQATGRGVEASGNGTASEYVVAEGRNKRSVWTVTTQPFPGAHFATFPPKLIEPCILAGSPEGELVLDPFAGAGTTGVVALRHSRSFVGIELNPAYAQMARNRIYDDAPLLNLEAP